MNFVARAAVILLPISVIALLARAQNPTAEKIEEAVIPKAVPVETYLEVWENSPFQLEAPAPEQADVAFFAQDLVLTGVLRVGDSHILTVLDKKSGAYSQVSEMKNSDGIRLLEVFPDQNPNLVTARIGQGDEEAKIGFDQALSTAAAKGPTLPPPKPKGANPMLQLPDSKTNPAPELNPSATNPQAKTRPPPEKGERRHLALPK